MAEGPIALQIRAKLTAALQPTRLELRDDSAKHAGHAGHNQAGESHFHLTITAAVFDGQRLIERHRLVHAALADMLRERVHALTITAKSVAEDAARIG
jgi:BolA family transcriptional regulator, general stress-responsive regulator